MQEKRPCGLNFVAGVKGPPAGLDVKVRELGVIGRLLSKLPAPEVSCHEGQHCSLDKRWSTLATGQEWAGRRKGSFMGANLTPQHCTGLKRNPSPSATALGAHGGVRMPATAAWDRRSSACEAGEWRLNRKSFLLDYRCHQYQD